MFRQLAHVQEGELGKAMSHGHSNDPFTLAILFSLLFLKQAFNFTGFPLATFPPPSMSACSCPTSCPGRLSRVTQVQVLSQTVLNLIHLRGRSPPPNSSSSLLFLLQKKLLIISILISFFNSWRDSSDLLCLGLMGIGLVSRRERPLSAF